MNENRKGQVLLELGRIKRQRMNGCVQSPEVKTEVEIDYKTLLKSIWLNTVSLWDHVAVLYEHEHEQSWTLNISSETVSQQPCQSGCEWSNTRNVPRNPYISAKRPELGLFRPDLHTHTGIIHIWSLQYSVLHLMCSHGRDYECMQRFFPPCTGAKNLNRHFTCADVIGAM